jgi:hypothetical protein
MSTDDFDTKHLRGQAKKAADVIVLHLTDFYDHAPDGGGCRTFYTPAEWRERGESYGRDSVLIVVHDGGDAAAAFSWDYECHNLRESLSDKLAAMGLYAEQCTSWYSAIYEL